MRGRNLCLLSLLTVLAAGGEPAASGYVDGHTTVAFDLYRDYLIVARGSAGSLKNLNFLVDTGATPTILDRRLAQKLHLEEQPGRIAVLQGSVQGGQAVAPSLDLGPMHRENFPVVIEDLSFFQKAIPVRIDAVVGLDVLGQSAFEIDYTSREIHFGPVPRLANSLPLRIMGGLPVVDAELNHHSAQLLFDTGAYALILFRTPAPDRASPIKVSAVERPPNTIGEFERKQVWVQNLKLGQAVFGREPAYLVGSRSDGGQSFDGLMSPAALGITKVAFDLERGVLAFSR
jgi:hypothetical protein